MATINMNEIPARGAGVVYDTAADTPIIGADADHSVLISFPSAIQVDTLPAATTIQVQQKLHADAEWVNVGAAIAIGDGPSMVVFDHRVNFVQLVRTGAGDVKAYSQG